MSNLRKVHQDIEQGNIASLYLFYGEETYLQQKLITALKEQILSAGVREFNFALFEGTEAPVSEIICSAETLPVIAGKRLVLVREALFFSGRSKYRLDKGDEELLLDYIKQPNPGTCLVFYLDGNVDGKKRIVKALKECGVVLETKRLYGHALTHWVQDMFTQRGKEIERSGLALLLTAGSGLAILEREVEKLLLYAGDAQKITRTMVEACLSRTAEGDVFKLVDAIGGKRPEEAVQRLREMLMVGEAPIQLLVMIGRQFRLLLALKVLLNQGYSTKKAGAKVKVHPLVLPKLVKQSRNFTTAQLEEAIMAAAKLDRQLKRSTVNPEMALELLVLKFSG